MIKQEIKLKKYNWVIHCYYAVDAYYTDEIVRELADAGCRGDYLAKAVENMNSGQLNHGLCYSNLDSRCTVFVVGLTSSAAQFLNSLTHELLHFVCHVCEATGVDVASEEAAYLVGEVAGEMYDTIVRLLCEHCRHGTMDEP